MAADPPDKLARDLVGAGYAGLFQTGDPSATDAVWHDGENREALREIVRRDESGDLERVLASEVLYRYDDGYPPEEWADTLGRVYAGALALTGTGDRPIVLTGNLWGYLGYAGGGDDGPLGARLLDAGQAAVPHLVPLLDDPAGMFYEGSREAMVGSMLGYRVKDAAAYFIERIKESQAQRG